MAITVEVGQTPKEQCLPSLTVVFQGLLCGKYWDFVRGGKGRAGLQGDSTSRAAGGEALLWWSLPSLREAVGSPFLFC